jgi:hypothetical protein
LFLGRETFCSAGNQSAELTGIRKFPISSTKSGQQQQIWSDSEILLAQISVCLRFLAGAHVFEAAEIQIREQILNPCLLLDSGLRDYEIKLDRGFSGEKTFSSSSFLQISLCAAD